MAAPLTIRLHPADNVVVARMDILPGTKVEGEVAAATRVPPGPQDPDPRGQAGRAAAQVQPDHRLCHRGHDARHAHPHAQLRHGRLRARLCLLRRRPADRLHHAGRDLHGLSPRRRPRGDAQLHRHRHHGELLGRDQPHDRGQARAAARAVSQHRRRRAADPWRRLRHGGVRPRDGRAAPHARGLHAPSQHGGGGGAGPGLRDQPDRRPDERRRIEGRAEADPHGHPGRGRRLQDRDARRRLPEGAAARGQRRQARADPGQRIDPGAAVRRIGRLFRHLGQSGAGRGGRPAGAPRRHGGAVGDAGDLRRRASADAPRGEPRGRREDRRAASSGGKTIARAPAAR